MNRSSEPHFATPRKRRRRTRITAGLIAILSVLALGIGGTMGQGQARAALPSLPSPTGTIGDVIAALANNDLTQSLSEQWRFDLCSSDSDGGPKNGGADCTGSTGAGVAVVLPSTIDLVPDAAYSPAQNAFNAAHGLGLDFGTGKILGVTVPVPDAALPEGSAKVIGDGFQFALASGGGNATAISYLPLSLATAGASDGRTAISFAVIGMANAWTTSEIPVEIFTIPTGLSLPAIQHVSCYGVLTAAYAEDVGACANVLGTFDFKLDQLQSIPQVQFALTDPTAMLFEPSEMLTRALTGLFNGTGFTLSKDFVRLSLGGDSLLALTSDYGLSAPVTVDWLGSTITIFPTTTINGSVRPNRLALPTIALGDLDTDQIIPIISIPKSTFPFGLQPLGPYTTGSTSTSSLVSARTLASTSTTPSAGLLRSAAISETDDDDTESDSATTTTTSPSTTSSSATATSGSTASSSSSSSSSSKTSTSTSRSTAATPSTGSTDDTDQSDDSDDDDTSSSNGSTPTVTGAN